MKTCTKCDKEKEDSEFHWTSRIQAYGRKLVYRHSHCKSCTAKKDLKRRIRNAAKWMKVFEEEYGKLKCQNCGFDIWEALEFHHIIARKGDMDKCIGNRMYTLNPDFGKGLVLREELKKCVLLCANCHRLIHAGKLSLDLRDKA